jgi:DNA-binding transcriptional regulator LsrR (DeoR family)
MSERDRTIVKALRLYYDQDLTQAEVARRLRFSRAKVSKLLAEGRARGLVRIEIVTTGGEVPELELALEERYGIGEAVVAATEASALETEQAVGAAAAAVLGRRCDARSTLGVSWGRALRGVASALPVHAFPCARVVSLVGAMGTARADLHSNQIGATIAAKLGVEHAELAAPAIAPSARARDELVELPGIREVVRDGAASDVAVVGIGGVLPGSTMIESGYFTREEFLALADRGAAGDVNWHFVDAHGRGCLPEMSARVVGLTLEQLAAHPAVIGVAYGAEKAAGLAAALAGGYLRVLVCDADLAQALIDLPTTATNGRPAA